MEPALVPEIPSISMRPSSRNLSITPQPNAPCEPPPCKARLIFLRPFEELSDGLSAVSGVGAMNKTLGLRSAIVRGTVVACGRTQRRRPARSLRGPSAFHRQRGSGDG